MRRLHCEFEETDPSNEILLFAKSISHWIQRQTVTRANSDLCSDVITQLSAIDLVPLTETVIHRAELRAQREKGRENWRGLIAYGKSIFHDRNSIGTEAGTAYQFPMDQFFELLIEDLLLITGQEVIAQARKPVLGKSYWEAASQMVDADDVESEERDDALISKEASIVSKPDIIMKDNYVFSVIECKYKPFKIPLIDGPPNTEVETGFKRNDRNQLLSFILSVEDSPDVGSRKVTFNVVFPHIGAQPVLYSDLVFRHATLQLSGGWKHLSQSISNLPSGAEPLKIRFVGVNVIECIKIVEAARQVPVGYERGSGLENCSPFLGVGDPEFSFDFWAFNEEL